MAGGAQLGAMDQFVVDEMMGEEDGEDDVDILFRMEGEVEEDKEDYDDEDQVDDQVEDKDEQDD